MTVLRSALVTCSELLPRLQAQETRLHAHSAHRNPGCLAQVLHPDFEAFSSVGQRYTREDVLRLLPLREERVTCLSDFSLKIISPGLAQLHYLCWDMSPTEGARTTRRCSLWQYSETGWQLRYHQATPACALSVSENLAA